MNPTLLESCSSMFSTECVVPERGIILVMVDASSHFKFTNLRILNWKLDMLYKRTCTTHTLDSQCKKSITSIWSEFFLLLMYQLIYEKNACQFQVHKRIHIWVLEFKWWKYYSLTKVTKIKIQITLCAQQIFGKKGEKKGTYRWKTNMYEFHICMEVIGDNS